MENLDDAAGSRPTPPTGPEGVTRGAILGIDPGEKRVGLALCHAGHAVAVGLPTFHAAHGHGLLQYLRELIETHQLILLVLGHPRTLQGESGPTAKRVEALARRLRRELGIPVELWDERLTTAVGRRLLQGSRAASGARDQIAATLILQSWLDRQEGVDREA